MTQLAKNDTNGYRKPWTDITEHGLEERRRFRMTEGIRNLYFGRERLMCDGVEAWE